MGNTFGHLFRITTFGESHGGGVGVVIDNCHRNWKFPEEIQLELDRRRPVNKSQLLERKLIPAKFFREYLRKRLERRSRFWCGTKTPVRKTMTRWRRRIAPSHADATYDAKYGIRNYQVEDDHRHEKQLDE